MRRLEELSDKTFWEQLGELKIDKDMNVQSYIVLKGISILKDKLQKSEQIYSARKKELIEDICRFSREKDLNNAKKNLQEIREALIVNGYSVKICKIKSSSRTLIGASELFGKNPFEVGLSFDPILNVPLIPSSTLKGAFRYALMDLVGREEGEGVAKEVADIIFGSKDWSGLAGVTDAYPVKAGINGLLDPDVITPHYPGAETEFDVKPNPVQFLTVARGVEYEFYIYFNKNIYWREYEWAKSQGKQPKRKFAKVDTVDIENLIHLKPTGDAGDQVKNVVGKAFFNGDLAEALRKLESMGLDIAKIIPWVDRAVLYAFARGVGAKTSLGYSRFEVLEYRPV
ncbi:MAG: type III-B CRISPR module RAMP protein Cmr6 [Infirmifilum sp.]